METQLKSFYEKVYSNEKEIFQLPVISYSKYPLNRTESALKYLVDNKISGKILELGAGNGTFVNSILKTNLNIEHYVATDLSENRLTAIKNSVNDARLEVKSFDLNNFNLQEFGQFDVIIMIALIEHLINPIETMQNVRKMLKKGGFVYIDTPNIAEIGCRKKLFFGKFPSTGSKNEGLTTWDGKSVENYDQGHFHYFTYRSLSLMLKTYCGFEKIEKFYSLAGKPKISKRFDNFLCKIKPELFSQDLVIIAR